MNRLQVSSFSFFPRSKSFLLDSVVIRLSVEFEFLDRIVRLSLRNLHEPVFDIVLLLKMVLAHASNLEGSLGNAFAITVDVIIRLMVEFECINWVVGLLVSRQ